MTAECGLQSVGLSVGDMLSNDDITLQPKKGLECGYVRGRSGSRGWQERRMHLQPNSLAKCPGNAAPMLAFDAEGGRLAGKGLRAGSSALTVLNPEPCWYGPCVSMTSPAAQVRLCVCVCVRERERAASQTPARACHGIALERAAVG